MFISGIVDLFRTPNPQDCVAPILTVSLRTFFSELEESLTKDIANWGFHSILYCCNFFLIYVHFPYMVYVLIASYLENVSIKGM